MVSEVAEQQPVKPGSQILALICLIEGVNDTNLEAILIFIYFKKVFDTLHEVGCLRY